jgi:hypothetical protein
LRWIASGVAEAFPQAEQRDDCFHALYELNKVRRRLEQGDTAEEEARQLAKIPAGDPKRRTRQRHRIGRARSRCQEAIERYDRFEVAMGVGPRGDRMRGPQRGPSAHG